MVAPRGPLFKGPRYMFDFPRVPQNAIMAVDSETTGVIYRRDRAFGFSVAFEGYAGYADIREQPNALLWLADAARTASRLVAHSAPFDYMMLRTAGLELPIEKLDDTVTRACLINEHEREYSLDHLAKKYLKASKDDSMYEKLSAQFGGRATRNVQMRNIADAPSSIVRPYAIQDAILTRNLWAWQENEIERQGIGGPNGIIEFERSLTPTLIRMMWRGIRVDTELAARARYGVLMQRDRAQTELDELIGKPVNVNSPPQIKAIFDPVKRKDGEWYSGDYQLGKTESGGASIGSEILRTMTGDRRAELILEVRSLIKTADTFLAGHIIGSAVDGRVYPSINQTKGETAGTGTGRLSYTTPALQQIPSRNKAVAALVKPAFLPDEGHVWLDADMASQEVRVFAHLINDEKLNKMYADDITTDFHQAVANLTGLPRNATYSGQANSKTLNLSMIFNSGDGATANKMGMPWTWEQFTTDDGEVVRYRKAGPEAMVVINRYHEMLPGVKKLSQKASKVAGSRGYIRTYKGRRMRFPDKRYLYKASGLLIQATAAEINKETIKLLEPVLDSHGAYLILNTHDSFSVSCPKDNVDACWKDMSEAVRDKFSWMKVPLMLELSGVGANWWEAVR